MINSYIHAANCGSPQNDDASIIVIGHPDEDYLALEGTNVTLNCPSGLTLTGPSLSVCMGNGEWEPDPREAKCKGMIVSNSIMHDCHLLCILNYYAHSSHQVYV